MQDGANARITGVTIQGGHPAANGGGIAVLTSTLTLSNSLVISNTAFDGGGIFNTGDLDIEGSTIRANQAITDGGGIYTDSDDPTVPGGQLLLTNSQLLSNTAQNGSGGGIYYHDTTPAAGLINLAGSTVRGNVALGALYGAGGGLFQEQGFVRLSAAAVSLNQAQTGAGVYDNHGRLQASTTRIETNTVPGAGQGGGLSASNAVVIFDGVTLRGNRAYSGGGIGSSFTRFDVQGSSFISNTATTFFGGGLYLSRTTASSPTPFFA